MLASGCPTNTESLVLQIQSNTHIDKKEKDEQRAANRRRYRVAIEP